MSSKVVVHDLIDSKSVRDCLDPTWKYDIGSSGKPLLRRQVLSRRRDAIKLSDRLLDAVDSGGEQVLPVFTAVFEILDANRPPMTGLSLRLPHDVVYDDNFRVAYDRAYPCTETSHSAIAFLEFNRSFRLVWDYSYGRNCMVYLRGISAYTLRVFPTTDNRPPLVDLLPPKILRQIISEAHVSGHEWRPQLLSYSMVQKSWAHVRDLFYSTYYRMGNRPTAVSVARSLRYHPEKAKLIPGFSPYHYSDADDNDWRSVDENDYLQTSRALLDIVELLDSMRRIVVKTIERSLIQDFLRRLCDIQGIEECEIRSDYHSTRAAKHWRRSLTISEIQTVIAHWPNLSSLDMSYCEDDETTG